MRNLLGKLLLRCSTFCIHAVVWARGGLLVINHLEGYKMIEHDMIIATLALAIFFSGRLALSSN